MDIISDSVQLQNKDEEVAQPADEVKEELNEEVEPKSEPQEVKAEPGPTVEAGAEPEAPVEEQAKMPSDVEIVEKLKELLSADGLDFQTVTERQLRQQLEQHFKVSLKEKKGVVKAEVLSWLDTLPKDENEGGDQEEDEEDEDKPAAKRRGGGLAAPCQLSEALQAFLGEESMPRTQVVQAVWKYIRENDRQNPSDRRKIILDDKLSTVFTSPLDMFSMNKQLSKHIFSPDPHAQAAAKAATPRKRKSESASKPAKRAKKTAEEGAPKRANGFQKPIQVSDELADFLGGKKEISRPEITKAFWAYFKENGLLNPSNKREVLADEKLESLFGEKKFLAFSIQRLIKPHVIPADGKVKSEPKLKKEVKEEVEVEVSDMDE